MSLRLLSASLITASIAGLGLVAWQAVRPIALPTVAQQVAAPVPLTVNVLVAAHALPAGTLIKDEDLSTHAVAAAQVGASDLTDSPEVRTTLRGALLRRWIDPGGVIATADVLRPRDRGFLAAVLTPGTRAVAVGVDAVTGTGGLIWPGDRVDVVLTQDLGDKDNAGHRVVGETVLSNVRVVAVDQSIMQGAAADAAAGKLARTVTLEVTPDQSERAAVAQQLGRLTLALRAAEEPGAAPRSGAAVYGSDVSSALIGSPVAPASRMRVIQGSESKEFTFR